MTLVVDSPYLAQYFSRQWTRIRKRYEASCDSQAMLSEMAELYPSIKTDPKGHERRLALLRLGLYHLDEFSLNETSGEEANTNGAIVLHHDEIIQTLMNLLQPLVKLYLVKRCVNISLPMWHKMDAVTCQKFTKVLLLGYLADLFVMTKTWTVSTGMLPRSTAPVSRTVNHGISSLQNWNTLRSFAQGMSETMRTAWKNRCRDRNIFLKLIDKLAPFLTGKPPTAVQCYREWWRYRGSAGCTWASWLDNCPWVGKAYQNGISVASEIAKQHNMVRAFAIALPQL